MEPLDTAWVGELRRQVEGHIEYFPLHRRLKALEPAVNEILAGLDPEQAKLLAEFYRVQQQIQVCLTKQAYLTGLQTARRRPER